MIAAPLIVEPPADSAAAPLTVSLAEATLAQAKRRAAETMRLLGWDAGPAVLPRRVRRALARRSP